MKAAQMNMIMNNDGRGGLFSVNSLKEPNSWPKEVSQKIQLGSMDYVMANPPFGAKIKIDSREILEHYDLAHGWIRTEDGKWQQEANIRNAMEPEVLFVERCIKISNQARVSVVSYYLTVYSAILDMLM
ncbi:MAG: N-6 DNA methylase [Bacteroidetes bacterium]|nr:N-6 DNA methylase [Bacteroidota bacterium]